MPHTDGGETSGKYRNISQRSSSPVSQNIIHNTGRESLNQFNSVSVETYQLISRVFMCAFNREISYFFQKRFPLFIPNFVSKQNHISHKFYNIFR